MPSTASLRLIIRPAAAVSLTAAVLLAAPGTAWGDVPALGEKTTVTANRPSSLLVDLRTSLSVDPFDPANRALLPSWEGGQEGILFVSLRKLGAQTGFGRQFSLTFLRLGAAGSGSGGWVARTPQGLRLPAGRYRLYVGATAPVRASLTFPSLGGGSVSLHADDPEPIDIGALPASPMMSPASAAFGRDGDLAAPGDLLLYGEFDEPGESTIDRVGACLYPGGGPPTGSAAYEPGCPSGSEVSFLRAQQPGGWGIFGMYDSKPAGTYGLGFNATHAGAMPPTRAWGGWVPVRDEAGQQAPAPEPEPEPDGGSVAEPEPHRRPATAAAGAVSVTTRSVVVRRGRIKVPLRCSGAGPCRGALEISGRSGRSYFALRAGAHARVALRVGHRRSRRATLVVIARTADGASVLRHRLRLR